MRFHNPIWLVIAALLLTSGCNLGQPTGGGTGVEGLSGTLVVPTGAAATGASVKIYAETTLGKRTAAADRRGNTGPLAKDAGHFVPFDSVVAGADGRFSFPVLADGTYTLLATYEHHGHQFVLLRSDVVVSGRTQLGPDTLRVSGGLTVMLDADEDALAGATCNLTGTPFHADVDSSDRCTLTGLPSGTFELTIEKGGVSGGVVGYFLVLPGTLTEGGVRPFPRDTVPPPSAPMLLAPAQGQSTRPADTLSWTTPANADGYHLQITFASDTTFASPSFEDSTLLVATHPVGPRLSGTSHAWRVRAWNAAGYGPWSTVRTFFMPDTTVAADTTHFGVTASTVALWSFDSVDNLGRYTDHSGNGRHLTAPPQASLTESPFGRAVTFNAGQYVSVTQDDSLVLAATPILSYEVRMWLDAYPSPDLAHGTATVLGQYGGLRMLITHDGRISVDGQTGIEGSWAWYGPVTDTGVMPLGQWVDVAVAADSPEGHLYLYVNGNAVQTYNNIEKGPLLRHLTTAEYPFTLGNDSQNSQPFPGKIDEIRVSNSLVLGPGTIPIVGPLPGR